MLRESKQLELKETAVFPKRCEDADILGHPLEGDQNKWRKHDQ